jgi:hypothetical protein
MRLRVEIGIGAYVTNMTKPNWRERGNIGRIRVFRLVDASGD